MLRFHMVLGLCEGYTTQAVLKCCNKGCCLVWAGLLCMIVGALTNGSMAGESLWLLPAACKARAKWSNVAVTAVHLQCI